MERSTLADRITRRRGAIGIVTCLVLATGWLNGRGFQRTASEGAAIAAPARRPATMLSGLRMGDVAVAGIQLGAAPAGPVRSEQATEDELVREGFEEPGGIGVDWEVQGDPALAWGRTECAAAPGGVASAWAVGGGPIGGASSCQARYRDPVRTLLVYGPIDASTYSNGLALALQIRADIDDPRAFELCAGAVDTNGQIQGRCLYISNLPDFSGEWATVDLTSGAEFPDVAGKSESYVWFEYVDASPTGLRQAVWIDNVQVFGRTGKATATPTPRPTPTPGRLLTPLWPDPELIGAVKKMLLGYYHDRRAAPSDQEINWVPRSDVDKTWSAKDPDTLWEVLAERFSNERDRTYSTSCHGARSDVEFQTCAGQRLVAALNIPGARPYTGGSLFAYYRDLRRPFEAHWAAVITAAHFALYHAFVRDFDAPRVAGYYPGIADAREYKGYHEDLIRAYEWHERDILTAMFRDTRADAEYQLSLTHRAGWMAIPYAWTVQAMEEWRLWQSQNDRAHALALVNGIDQRLWYEWIMAQPDGPPTAGMMPLGDQRLFDRLRAANPAETGRDRIYVGGQTIQTLRSASAASGKEGLWFDADYTIPFDAWCTMGGEGIKPLVPVAKCLELARQEGPNGKYSPFGAFRGRADCGDRGSEADCGVLNLGTVAEEWMQAYLAARLGMARMVQLDDVGGDPALPSNPIGTGRIVVQPTADARRELDVVTDRLGFGVAGWHGGNGQVLDPSGKPREVEDEMEWYWNQPDPGSPVLIRTLSAARHDAEPNHNGRYSLGEMANLPGFAGAVKGDTWNDFKWEMPGAAENHAPGPNPLYGTDLLGKVLSDKVAGAGLSPSLYDRWQRNHPDEFRAWIWLFLSIFYHCPLATDPSDDRCFALSSLQEPGNRLIMRQPLFNDPNDLSVPLSQRNAFKGGGEIPSQVVISALDRAAGFQCTGFSGLPMRGIGRAEGGTGPAIMLAEGGYDAYNLLLQAGGGLLRLLAARDTEVPVNATAPEAPLYVPERAAVLRPWYTEVRRLVVGVLGLFADSSAGYGYVPGIENAQCMAPNGTMRALGDGATGLRPEQVIALRAKGYSDASLWYWWYDSNWLDVQTADRRTPTPSATVVQPTRTPRPTYTPTRTPTIAGTANPSGTPRASRTPIPTATLPKDEFEPIREWNADRVSEIRSWSFDAGANPYAAAPYPRAGASLVAHCGKGGEVMVRDVRQGIDLFDRTPFGDCYSVEFDPEGVILFASGNETGDLRDTWGSVVAYDWRNDVFAGSLRTGSQPQLRLARDGTALVVSDRYSVGAGLVSASQPITDRLKFTDGGLGSRTGRPDVSLDGDVAYQTLRSIESVPLARILDGKTQGHYSRYDFSDYSSIAGPVAIAPSGLVAAGGANGTITLGLSGRRSVSIGSRPVTALRFNPDGDVLAVLTDDGKLRLLATTDLRVLAALANDGDTQDTVEFSIRGDYIVSTSKDRVRFWAVDSRAPVVPTASPTAPSGGGAEPIGPGNASRLKTVRTINFVSWVNSAALAPAGDALALCGGGSETWVVDPQSGGTLASFNAHPDCSSTQFDASGRVLYTSGGGGAGDGKVKAWDWRARRLSWSTDVAPEPWGAAMRLSSDEQWMVTSGPDTKIWQIAPTGLQLRTIVQAPGINGRPDITASGLVAFWNYGVQIFRQDGTFLRNMPATSEDWMSMSVGFSPDGTRVVGGDRQGVVRVWSVANGQELGVLRGHTDWIYAARFSPDGQLIVSASNDHTVRVWDASTFRLLITLTGHSDRTNEIAISADGTMLVTTSADQSARVWQVR